MDWQTSLETENVTKLFCLCSEVCKGTRLRPAMLCKQDTRNYHPGMSGCSSACRLLVGWGYVLSCDACERSTCACWRLRLGWRHVMQDWHTASLGLQDWTILGWWALAEMTVAPCWCVMAAQKPPVTVTVTKQQQAFLITQKHIYVVCMWAHMCVYAYKVWTYNTYICRFCKFSKSDMCMRLQWNKIYSIKSLSNNENQAMRVWQEGMAYSAPKVHIYQTV